MMFWTQAKRVSQKALESGALHPIATEPGVIHENGVDFQIHIINENLGKKIAVTKTQGNPFLPYEASMFVADAGDTHVCLLNRFPVLTDHLLICSKAYEEQTAPLTLENFRAWISGFDSPEVLGFYNGGEQAGASQPHRHMQLVKMPLPLEAKILAGNLPFYHELIRFEQLDADKLYADFQQRMQKLDLFGDKVCQPFNLLLRANWMLLLPRSQKSVEGIFLNGLNYAGIFLFRNEAQRQMAQQHGLMNILSEASKTSN